MSVSDSVAEILSDHVTYELESIDRMYLNLYQPRLQSEKQLVAFFRFHRGHTFASSALMNPMSKQFVVEEAFFRRVLMDELLGPAWPTVAQVLASGLIFGLAHGIWGIMTRRVAVGVGTMIATGTLGAALAVVYVVGNRSLAPVIVAHFIITATIQPGITFAAFSGQMRTAPLPT